MDLQTIRESVQQKKYHSREEFLADIKQVGQASHFYQCCGSGAGSAGSGVFFGPPGSGSGSFYYQAKIVRKTLLSTVL
jgi:hypothetical protein